MNSTFKQILQILVTLIVVLLALTSYVLIETNYLAKSMGFRAYDLSVLVEDFKSRYKALPGDFKDASNALPGCDASCNPPDKGAGDGILGDPDFARHITPPPTEGEARLFWKHLEHAGLYNGRTRNSSFMLWDTHYAAGHFDGGPVANADFGYGKEFTRQKQKGLVLVLYSGEVWRGEAKMDTPDMQPLTPTDSAAIDRKHDDDQPGTGTVQAYGAPDCVKKYDNERAPYQYNESNMRRDCGLIFLIDGYSGEKK